ncbi:phosphatidylserine decarboxylase [candidate division KSB1 bacterium]|nr:phosphatidylserine decarboxylase [candidate division KSB1 bacterium]
MRGVLIVSGVICLSITILSFFWGSVLLLVSAFILGWIAFVLYFARNPERSIPTGENLVVAPADGRVMSIIQEDGIRIHIFLSLFDVHVNRIPIQGVVKKVQYQSGKYLPAFLSKAGNINERNTIHIKSKYGSVQFSQIAGLIARRIVCKLTEEQSVDKGEIFGMIKFGSGIELILPASIQIKIKEGDRVRAGESIIGEFVDEV